MYMGANFLTRLCRPEDSDNRNVGGIFGSRRFITLGQLRVEFGGSGLVMIDAVESNSEEIHGRSEKPSSKSEQNLIAWRQIKSLRAMKRC